MKFASASSILAGCPPDSNITSCKCVFISCPCRTSTTQEHARHLSPSHRCMHPFAAALAEGPQYSRRHLVHLTESCILLQLLLQKVYNTAGAILSISKKHAPCCSWPCRRFTTQPVSSCPSHSSMHPVAAALAEVSQHNRCHLVHITETCIMFQLPLQKVHNTAVVIFSISQNMHPVASALAEGPQHSRCHLVHLTEHAPCCSCPCRRSTTLSLSCSPSHRTCTLLQLPLQKVHNTAVVILSISQKYAPCCSCPCRRSTTQSVSSCPSHRKMHPVAAALTEGPQHCRYHLVHLTEHAPCCSCPCSRSTTQPVSSCPSQRSMHPVAAALTEGPQHSRCQLVHLTEHATCCSCPCRRSTTQPVSSCPSQRSMHPVAAALAEGPQHSRCHLVHLTEACTVLQLPLQKVHNAASVILSISQKYAPCCSCPCRRSTTQPLSSCPSQRSMHPVAIASIIPCYPPSNLLLLKSSSGISPDQCHDLS
jgi:hypothetical protein